MARRDIYNESYWKEAAQIVGYRVKPLCIVLKLSQRQLQRYTRRLFNKSPQEWLNSERLSIAAELLEKDKTIKEVAFELGFKQLSHFSREFRSHYGLAPRAFLGMKRSIKIRDSAHTIL